MAFIKNCYKCSNRQPEYYQEASCKAEQVAIFAPDAYGNICKPSYPKCNNVHPNQDENCLYFKRSFASRVAEWKSKICAWIFNKKMEIKDGKN
jgi:hypothetical protein